MANIFSADPVEIDLSFNDVVGEDKKYKDPDALAKAYANIERHARTLEAENAAVRAERDAIQAMQGNPNSNDAPRQEQPKPNDPPAPTPNPTPNPGVDLRSQIQEEMRVISAEDRARNNIESVAEQMAQTYGSPAAANEAIRKRAQELGMSVEDLRDTAAKAPKAFFATMGTPEAGTSRSTPAPHNDFVSRDSNGSQRNFEYFDNIRKNDSKLYFSAATQREMMQQAKAQGADFYKR